MARSTPLASLLYSDSEHHADQLYVGRFLMGDPYIVVVHGRTRYAVLNSLEFSRGKKESLYDVIVSQEDLAAQAKARFKVERPTAADLIATFAAERSIPGFRVPGDFPAAEFVALQKRGVSVEVVEGVFLPERELKSDAEAAFIREGNRVSALGIAAGAAVLKASKIRGDRLVWKGREVTSELLREEISVACLRAGGIAAHTIVAGGDQACDPHCRGTGPIRPNELVILDVFPRLETNGYWGDMTRTFLKGRASEAQRSLVAAVAEAQKAALVKVKAGVTGKAVHGEVLTVFKKRGFETTRDERGPRGFIHGTGHGLGLAIHESPRVNSTGPKLKAGMVVTIEPGLYYPGVGGARIEDVVRVTKGGSELLSEAPYDWEFA